MPLEGAMEYILLLSPLPECHIQALVCEPLKSCIMICICIYHCNYLYELIVATVDYIVHMPHTPTKTIIIYYYNYGYELIVATNCYIVHLRHMPTQTYIIYHFIVATKRVILAIFLIRQHKLTSLIIIIIGTNL